MKSEVLMTVERLTAAEIAAIAPAAARVLEEHGIDYCADANRTLQEICSDRTIDLATIQHKLSNVRPADREDRDWTTAPIRELIDHLVTEEHTFFRSELEILERRLTTVVERHGQNHPQMVHVLKVFRTLREDLEMHMKHEESQVFPAIEKYIAAEESGQPLKGSPLAAFGGPMRVSENEHETAGASLRLIRDFAFNYQMPDDGCPRFRAVLAGLQELEDRLLRHIYIENNVLFPRCSALKAPRATPVGD
jgi:regulator of cell morphogenesis and NO signaling